MLFDNDSRSRIDFERDVYTVSRLNSEVRAVLEGSFPLLWVEGEISNLATPSSGHIYFSLKDAHAQVRCAMFRMKRMRLRFSPENGMQVRIRAKVGLYEGRGEFQLVVEHMEPAGEGALQQAFDRLKQKLTAEGLFDGERKREWPHFPKQVGVITSPSGAAVRDVLSALRRRFPGLPVVIYPVLVQGDGAAEQIRKALEVAGRRADCDVLLLVRGGGSLEDLMAFNDESVARAIVASPIPVVTGIGHEVDFTIADFVADRRAATPTAAAELVSPDGIELTKMLAALEQNLAAAGRRRLEGWANRVRLQERRMQLLHPSVQLAQRSQRIDELELRLRQTLDRRLEFLGGRIDTLKARLGGQTPLHRLERGRWRLAEARKRLVRALSSRLAVGSERLARAGGMLDAVSPLATLSRGYAIVTEHPGEGVIRDAAEVEPGSQVKARLATGSLVCRVERRED